MFHIIVSEYLLKDVVVWTGPISGTGNILREFQRSWQRFRLNGNDYDTPDGSCVRDHVHVQDVARLHELACADTFDTGVYNVGIEHGVSNIEIMHMAQDITGLELDFDIGPRRAGDPSQLLAATDRLRAQGWQPQYSLKDMIQHAWAWYNR